MKNELFVVVRYDTERDIVRLGTAVTLEAAQDIMGTDFKKWFEEKYGYEMKQRNISYEDMLEELNGSDELELADTTAYLNECNHVDFDWSIFEIEISEESRRAAFDEYRIAAAKEDVARVAEDIGKETYSDEDLTYLAGEYLNNMDCNLTINDQIEELLNKFDERGRKHD